MKRDKKVPKWVIERCKKGNDWELKIPKGRRVGKIKVVPIKFVE